MNEEKIVEMLNAILADINTGPLSDIGAGLAEVNSDGHLELQIEPPFASVIDTPHLVREFVPELHERVFENLCEVLVDHFNAGHATRTEEFAEIAVVVVKNLMVGGLK